MLFRSGTRCDPDGEERVVAPILERLGYQPARAKTNMGLGRINLRQLEPVEQKAERVKEMGDA